MLKIPVTQEKWPWRSVPSSDIYTLQHDTHCNKLSFISRSKFKSLYALQGFISIDQVSYPSNTDFPNFPELNCSVNGQDTGLSADRSPHNVLVMAKHPKRWRYSRFMGASICRDASLILQVCLSGFIPSSATPFTEDVWLCSPLSWWDKGIVLLSPTCETVPVRGKIGQWLNLTRYRSSLTTGLALPPYRVHVLCWRYSQQIIYSNQSSDPFFSL